MNAYWIVTKVITINEAISVHGEYMGSQKMQWGTARLVYANSRSQARYIFWRDCWHEDTGCGFDECLDDIKTIRLIAKNVDHSLGTEDFPNGDDYWDDKRDVYDYRTIKHPVWREIARRFWNEPGELS